MSTSSLTTSSTNFLSTKSNNLLLAEKSSATPRRDSGEKQNFRSNVLLEVAALEDDEGSGEWRRLDIFRPGDFQDDPLKRIKFSERRLVCIPVT